MKINSIIFLSSESVNGRSGADRRQSKLQITNTDKGSDIMQKKITGKKVVITGGSSGIGAEMGLEAARRGALPVLLARSEEKLKETAAVIFRETGVEAAYFCLDVSNAEQVQQVFNEINEEIGDIDVLINNAGFGIFDYVAEASLADIEEMFKVNVFGTISATKAVLPEMITRNSGQIIFVASIAGKLATAKSSGYSASKHAVIGFANALRMEMHGSNVSVSTVNPGPIETAFFERADKEGTYKKNITNIMMQAEDVAVKTINLLGKRKRELNIPFWMGAAAKVHQIMPSFAEWAAGSRLRKK